MMRKGASWLRDVWESRLNASSPSTFGNDALDNDGSPSDADEDDNLHQPEMPISRNPSASCMHNRTAECSPEGHFIICFECAGQLDRAHSNVFASARISDQCGRPKGKAVYTLSQMRTAKPAWKVPRDLLTTVQPSDLIIIQLFSPDWTRPIAQAHGRAGLLLEQNPMVRKSSLTDMGDGELPSSDAGQSHCSLAGANPAPESTPAASASDPALVNDDPNGGNISHANQSVVVHLPLWNTVRIVPGCMVLRSFPFREEKHQRKRLFLIRHAQSRWNEAQATRKYAGMLAYDHPLTPEGARQALALHSSWQPNKINMHDAPDSGDWIQSFLQADGLLCSPLTRALQTAVLALEDHPASERGNIKLLPSLRELKTRGGFDSVGKCRGSEILQRCQEKLVEVVGETKTKTAMSKWNIDVERCQAEWWTAPDDADSESEATERVADILNAVRFLSDSHSVIAVGHSGIFQSLCKRAISQALLAAEESPVGGSTLVNKKLTNASVLGLDIAFGQTGTPSILEARLLFRSSLSDSGQQHPQHNGTE